MVEFGRIRESLSLPVATLVSASAAAAVATAVVHADVNSMDVRPVDVALWLFFIFPICIPYVMVFGLPLGLFLVHKKLFKPVPALLAGAVAAVPAVILLISNVGPHLNEPIAGFISVWPLVVTLFLTGSITGIVFYWTYNIVNPKPDAPVS